MSNGKKVKENKVDTEVKEEAVADDATTPTWFILDRNRSGYGLQMECQKTEIHPQTGERVTMQDSFNRCIMFEHGLYLATDKDEIEFLKTHKLGEKGSTVADSFRECTPEEVLSISHLESQGTLKKEWHGRIKAVEKALAKG